MVVESKPGYLVLNIALLIDTGLLVGMGMQCLTVGLQARGPRARGPLVQTALAHIGLIEEFAAGYLARTTTTLIGTGLLVATVEDQDPCGKE